MNITGKSLTRLGAGDQPLARADYDQRFAAMRPRLLAICLSLVGRDAAEDIVQDTYLRARARRGQLKDADAFEAWLARIAVNNCYNHHRAKARLGPSISSVLGRHAQREQRDAGLRELIERLPARARTVIVLHYGYGYGLDEIAAFLNVSHVSVRSVVHRARKRLAAQWQEADQ